MTEYTDSFFPPSGTLSQSYEKTRFSVSQDDPHVRYGQIMPGAVLRSGTRGLPPAGTDGDSTVSDKKQMTDYEKRVVEEEYVVSGTGFMYSTDNGDPDDTGRFGTVLLSRYTDNKAASEGVLDQAEYRWISEEEPIYVRDIVNTEAATLLQLRDENPRSGSETSEYNGALPEAMQIIVKRLADAEARRLIPTHQLDDEAREIFPDDLMDAVKHLENMRHWRYTPYKDDLKGRSAVDARVDAWAAERWGSRREDFNPDACSTEIIRMQEHVTMKRFFDAASNSPRSSLSDMWLASLGKDHQSRQALVDRNIYSYHQEQLDYPNLRAVIATAVSSMTPVEISKTERATNFCNKERHLRPFLARLRRGAVIGAGDSEDGDPIERFLDRSGEFSEDESRDLSSAVASESKLSWYHEEKNADGSRIRVCHVLFMKGIESGQFGTLLDASRKQSPVETAAGRNEYTGDITFFLPGNQKTTTPP